MEGVWEYIAEKGTWAQDKGNSRLRKTAEWGASICTPHQIVLLIKSRDFRVYETGMGKQVAQLHVS